jgi:hypothetical protein
MDLGPEDLTESVRASGEPASGTRLLQLPR